MLFKLSEKLVVFLPFFNRRNMFVNFFQLLVFQVDFMLNLCSFLLYFSIISQNFLIEFQTVSDR